MSATQAIRDHLVAGFTGLTFLESVNANPKTRPAAGFWTLEFNGGPETQSSFGAPGANLYRTQATALVHIFTPAGRGPEAAEAFAEAVRALLRGRRLTTLDSPARTVRIKGADEPTPQGVEGRFYQLSVGFSFWYDTPDL